ncbi:septal ring lytic transglycosylase RlpA family protein [Acidithiobacillus sp.]|uniref:septal ring lytic transglycosylase RlpA family protein n=1 Tax=Acidithiobacillus sp. TaxID=1872118 RepID=UPI0025C27DCA|nr:septal ring lytic transglycosylase RlpA family protein [Acidithiobacillus sp.]MCK9188732.1 septal ring lytic transglycosylase RlpA family protein [Acidithiobacillus sp.]MCK9359726.1 septal ring lytic transglycosylase RlpA family protein [Acidithiobacillus sp.]
MGVRYHLRVFRLGAFGFAAAALAGCASMPSHMVGTSGGGHGSAIMGSAYSTGQDCHAPVPDPNAAYNQPYEINGDWYHPMRGDAGFSENGIASWYDQQSSSAVTAMGTAFHARQMTAASRTLPLPSCVRVTNLKNGRSVVVLVDDRGPFVSGRIMDMSYGAASQLGMLNQGTTPVHIQVIPSNPGPSTPLPQVLPVAQQRIASKKMTPVPVLRTPTAIPVPAYMSPASANLTAVVDDAFSNSPVRAIPAVQKAPPVPVPPRFEAGAHTLRRWREAPPPKQIYLETANSMELQTAVRERSKLQDFGISTAQMVPVSSTAAGGLYKVKIGPMAPTAAPEDYAASLQRLRLGTFVVSAQEG